MVMKKEKEEKEAEKGIRNGSKLKPLLKTKDVQMNVMLAADVSEVDARNAMNEKLFCSV